MISTWFSVISMHGGIFKKISSFRDFHDLPWVIELQETYKVKSSFSNKSQIFDRAHEQNRYQLEGIAATLSHQLKEHVKLIKTKFFLAPVIQFVKEWINDLT